MEILLTQGKKAIIDDEDYPLIKDYSWHLSTYGSRFCAIANSKSGLTTKIKMHRLILGAKPGQEVDHRDGDSLNNQKSNLRIATHQENIRNRRLNVNNKCGFKGVSLCKKTGKFRAEIAVGRLRYFLGHFVTPEEAAKAYDNAARKYHGEFARTNFGKDGVNQQLINPQPLKQEEQQTQIETEKGD